MLVIEFKYIIIGGFSSHITRAIIINLTTLNSELFIANNKFEFYSNVSFLWMAQRIFEVV